MVSRTKLNQKNLEQQGQPLEEIDFLEIVNDLQVRNQKKGLYEMVFGHNIISWRFSLFVCASLMFLIFVYFNVGYIIGSETFCHVEFKGNIVFDNNFFNSDLNVQKATITDYIGDVPCSETFDLELKNLRGYAK